MIHTEAFLPDDLSQLIDYLNKVNDGNNYSVFAPTGDVYGWFLLDPEFIQRKKVGKRFELWGGDQFTGITTDSLESMTCFLQGVFYATFVEILGDRFEEDHVHRLIEDIKSKQPTDEEVLSILNAAHEEVMRYYGESDTPES